MIIKTAEELISIAEDGGSNKAKITRAIDNESLIATFCSRSNNDLIYGWLKTVLTTDKFSQFASEFKNYLPPIINQIQTHYSKIFSPPDSRTNIVFDDNVTDKGQLRNEVDFNKEIRDNLFHQTSDINFFTSYAIDILIKNPNSTLFISPASADSTPQVKCYDVNMLHAYSQVYGELMFVMYKSDNGSDGNKLSPNESMFFGGDSEKYFSFIIATNKEGESFVKEYTEVRYDSLGLKEVPFLWLQSENSNDEDGIKKSIIQDVLTLMNVYVIFMNANQQYKISSAYPLTGYARTSKLSGKKNGLPPDMSGADYILPGMGKASPEKKQYPYKLGAHAEVDVFEGMKDAEDVKAYVAAHFRLESDTNILEFHASDSKAAKNNILDNAIGTGFTSTMSNQAINEVQVITNFDDIETNLAAVARSVEKAWSKMLRVSGQIYSSAFKDADVFLGRQYLFKSFMQLIEELAAMTKAQMSKVDIESKQIEIRSSQHKHSKVKLAMLNFEALFQPFASYTEEFIISNKDWLSEVQPLDFALYMNFNTIISEYKTLNGGIPLPATKTEKMSQYVKIKEELYKLAEALIERNKDAVTVSESKDNMINKA